MYGATMLAPDFAQAALGQALLAQAVLADAQMQLANAQAQAAMQAQAQAQAQAQMMPQAFGAFSPFAAAPGVAAPQGPQAAQPAPTAPIGLGGLFAKAFPRPLISCWGGVSKEQFDLINRQRAGLPGFLPFAAGPDLAPFSAEPELAPLGFLSQFMPRTLRDSMSEPYGFTGELRWKSPPLGTPVPGAALLPFSMQPMAAAPQPAPAAPQAQPGVFAELLRRQFGAPSGLSQFFKPRWGDTIPDLHGQGPRPINLLPFAAAPDVQAQQQPQLTLQDLALLQLAALAEQQQMQAFAAGPELAPMFIPPTAQQMIEWDKRFRALFPTPLPQLPFGLPGPFSSPGQQIGNVLAGQPPTSAKPQMPWQLASPPLS